MNTGRKMVPTYHDIVPPNACSGKKQNKTILPMQGSTAVLSPFRIPVSYYLEIANHCFLSYTLKRKRRLPTS